MKLRIDGDSLRLRLNRSDVQRFRETGTSTESIRFCSGSELTYMLETSSELTRIEARYRQDCIRVLVPLDMAQEWASSDQVSLSVDRAEGSGPALLIEKDFQCLYGDRTNPNDDADVFPNPSAGNQRRARW